MKLILSLFFTLATLAASQSLHQFHEYSPGRWQTPTFLVESQGFAVSGATAIHRFRWMPGPLSSLSPQQPTVSNSIIIGPTTRTIRAAHQLRAAWPNGSGLRFYFGPRGLEFDVELPSISRLPEFLFESLDADLTTNPQGDLMLGSSKLLSPPVAFSGIQGSLKTQHSFKFEIVNSRLVRILPANNFHIDEHTPLIIDPVVTYASYLGGSGETQLLDIRELADGVTLVIGRSTSADFPPILWLTGSDAPTVVQLGRPNCFVARFRKDEGSLLGTSFIAGVACSAFDLDSSGRILIFGGIQGPGFQPTANAEFGAVPPQVLFAQSAPVLLQLSADARKLEYATFLDLPREDSPVTLISQPGNRVALGFRNRQAFAARFPAVTYSLLANPAATNPYWIFTYDLTQRRFTSGLRWGAGEDYSIGGLVRTSSGELLLFGQAPYRPGSSDTLEQILPIQRELPQANAVPGFVVRFNQSLTGVNLSSYFGGLRETTNPTNVVFDRDGNWLILGIAAAGSFPGQSFDPDTPTSGDGSLGFLISYQPGQTGAVRSFFGGPALFLPRAQLFQFPDGRTCLHGVNRRPLSPLSVACLSQDWSGFDAFVSLDTWAGTGLPVSVSGSDALWLQLNTPRGTTIPSMPPSLSATAFQPIRPSGFNTLLLQRLSLFESPPPEYTGAQPLRLDALQIPFTTNVAITGKNFAAPLHLVINDTLLQLAVRSPSQAFLPVSQSTGLRAGEYSVRIRSGELESEPFPLLIANMRPSIAPVTPRQIPSGSVPINFTVLSPVYPETEIYFRGQKLEQLRYISPAPSPTGGDPRLEFTLPADTFASSVTGEFIVRNPGPGGGTVIQQLNDGPPENLTLTSFRFNSDFIIPDAPRNRFFNIIRGLSRSVWTVELRSMPEGSIEQSLSFPRVRSNETLTSRAISSDGATLRLLFSDGRLLKITTASMTITGEIPNAPRLDNPQEPPPVISLGGNQPLLGYSLLPFADDPDSFVISTQAGEMLIYTNDQPRLFDTGYFSRSPLQALTALLATRQFIYASAGSCLIRYQIDDLGFFPPELLCDFPSIWGKYPEMKIRAGNRFTLEAESTQVFLLPSLTPLQLSLIARGVSVPESGWFLLGNSQGFRPVGYNYRIDIEDLATGKPLGHFPKTGFFTGRTNFFSIGDSLIIQGGTPFMDGQANIIRKWRENVELYDRIQP